MSEVAFEVVNRQQLADPPPGVMNPPVRLAPGSKPMPPRPGERGRKDSVLAYPGQVLRVRARFVQPGQFVWHCHVLEHEDNEMMRPLRVGPVQPGQPG